MIKKVLLLLLSLLVLLSATGCHGSKDIKEFALPEEFDTSKTYEITFWAKNDTNKAQTNIYHKAIEDFVMEIKAACEALISNIKGFKDDLKAVKAAMEAKAQNVNTSVNTKKNELNSSKSSWTYSGASN